MGAPGTDTCSSFLSALAVSWGRGAVASFLAGVNPPALSHSALQTVMSFVMRCEPGQGGLVCWTVDAVSLWSPQGKTQNRTANASPPPQKSICLMPKQMIFVLIWMIWFWMIFSFEKRLSQIQYLLRDYTQSLTYPNVHVLSVHWAPEKYQGLCREMEKEVHRRSLALWWCIILYVNVSGPSGLDIGQRWV